MNMAKYNMNKIKGIMYIIIGVLIQYYNINIYIPSVIDTNIYFESIGVISGGIPHLSNLMMGILLFMTLSFVFIYNGWMKLHNEKER